MAAEPHCRPPLLYRSIRITPLSNFRQKHFLSLTHNTVHMGMGPAEIAYVLHPFPVNPN
jgi:hypothetical protein